MFPIGDDDVRGAGPGIVTVGLVLVNVAVFIAEVTIFRPGLRELFNEYGVVPAQVLNGRQLYSFVTSLSCTGDGFT